MSNKKILFPVYLRGKGNDQMWYRILKEKGVNISKLCRKAMEQEAKRLLQEDI